ncbi:caM kinase-like vesicle-associated, like [Esox lucius]|uniref:caM kinase-like vesicle-associated, like n=1 Tax=Esox lucius TaxID=8010 RepID=UPI001477389C|nr:caM kinase-like vesicle-associated, like [Esox lucius]
MPFGCLALRDGRNLDSISDVTDKYEIGQVLKAKEFCELCLAKDRQTNKVFVCKKFFKKDGRKVRKAAKNEILILKMVNHPNILQLIDTFETKKEFFIIQELATGGDVFDWILDQGNYTERDASNVIRQVLEAVAYLHSLNIVHRNLKLENLMYYTENNHNKVVLRDFYLSKFENGSITEPCGTPEYLAPEVVARHRYGRPVDCWAVGVIMYILLSGNPPFYDETEEENTDLHNRIIFCRIVAGEFEFDSPYWDDISVPAKELVCRLMEVDQMLRITAADALFHEWIAGNGASEKNLKDGVCAQFEKNFAKAKWRKAIRVTTFMQRLRASEAAASEAAREAGSQGGQSEGGEGELGKTEEGKETPGRVSLEVTVEASPEREARNGGIGEEKREGEGSEGGRISPSATKERLTQPANQSNASSKPQGEEPEKTEVVLKASSKTAATLDSTTTTTGTKTPPTPTVTSELTKPKDPIPDLHTPASSLPRKSEKKHSPYVTSETPTTQRRKMAAHLHNTGPASATATAAPVPAATAPPAERRAAVQVPVERRLDMEDSSWCQTQLPEAVAERRAGGGSGLGVGSMGVGTGMEKGGVTGHGVVGSGTGVVGSGQGVVGSGQGVVGSGPGVVGSGHGVVGSGQGVVGSGTGVVGSGQGVVGSGQGVVGSGHGVVGSGHGVVGSGQGVVGSGQGVVGSGQGVVGSGHGVVGSGSGVVGSGQGGVGSGPGIVGSGPGVVGSGSGVVGSGQGVVGSGPAVVGSGPRVVGSGQGVVGSGPGVVGSGLGLRGDTSPMSRERRSDRQSSEFGLSRGAYSYTRVSTAYGPEVELGGYGGSYCSSLYSSGPGGGAYAGLEHTGLGSGATDWQMDSVIEQIEKQMAAVLEKIEGDMPSLLEQISDCPAPPEPPRASRSTHTSPSHLQQTHPPSSSSSLTSSTPPPPLPTTPRPPLPSLPHLTIPPPSYPPPSPPTHSPGQPTSEHEERDGQRGAGQYSQSPSPRPGRGL